MTETEYKQFVKGLPKALKDKDIKYRDHRDRIFSHLILMDYDWMHYRLQAEIPIENNNVMLVEFLYFGSSVCNMTVQINKQMVRYEYDSEIFKKYLEVYLDRHAESLKSGETFSAGDIVMDFYNEVMSLKNKPVYINVDPIILPQQ